MQEINKHLGLFVFCSIVALLCKLVHAQEKKYAATLQLKGLKEEVKVIRDQWGISHIYAKNEHDLFFAQGYTAATDRLFQLELWRRQATGTLSEWLGPEAVKRDIGLRLFRFRGDMEQEMAHYHPHGKLIITAFVEGVNARIATMRRDTANLPLEFKLLKTLPDYWTPEVVISRHQGLVGNLISELDYGRQVHIIGEAKTRALNGFHPTLDPHHEPHLPLEEGIDGEGLFEDILTLYSAFRAPVKFSAPIEKYSQAFDFMSWYDQEKEFTGSNNWALSGKRTQSGFPMFASDPHRTQSVPSLRYWIHLQAPGWNVIGGGEPSLPGVSFGHNERGAWGGTISKSDIEDLYVYDLNPDHPNQYRYKGKWESMLIRKDTLQVKDLGKQEIVLRYTRHGPVIFADSLRHKVYAVRAAWLDIGCAPYLASLRIDQATDWKSFREACSYSFLPSSNMIWADRKGHIGWQIAGMAVQRPNWTGLVPVPGDGRFEWTGYFPIKELPHVQDPADQYLASANSNLTLPDFKPRNALGWEWSTPYRKDRISEVLRSRKTFTIADFMQLQSDYLSIPARTLTPILLKLSVQDDKLRKVRDLLKGWDWRLQSNSKAATVYVEWEDQIKKVVHHHVVPPEARPHLRSLSTKIVLDSLTFPSKIWFGSNAAQVRDSLLLVALQQATTAIKKRLGSDISSWTYGQPANKHIFLQHAFSDWVDEDTRREINLGPVPRGGYSETVNNAGTTLNQTHGASFRTVVDLRDWDNAMGINSPGQSGDPASSHYRDLFELWKDNQYFPLYFSKEKIAGTSEQAMLLQPD
jgi:penicillin G amidase